MRRVLGVLEVLGVVLLVCALLVGALVAGVFLTHPRDEPGYVHYVRKYGDYDGRRANTAATDTDLIAAGNRACDWLKHRRPALWRADARHRLDGLSDAFEESRPKDDRKLPTSVVPGAWTYLCPATRALIMPHRPWERGD
jgi:hypothetical protein